MTRQEYLSELKYELRTLPVEEQEEALEYYRCYFDDAEDDAKVIEEFGSPRELAESIMGKFASLPQVNKPSENSSSDGSFGNFSSSEVRSLDISVGVAEVVIAGEGDRFCVEYRNLEPGDIKCSLSPFGTFCVENKRRLPDISRIFQKEKEKVNHARILIKIPSECRVDLLRLHVGAGSLVTKNVTITSSRSYMDVGAGNLEAGQVLGGCAELHVGMGHLSYRGSVSGKIKAECGLGQIEMFLKGKESDYSMEAKVGLGSVSFNGQKKDGFGNLEASEIKANHFAVQCGLGEVKIKMSEN